MVLKVKVKHCGGNHPPTRIISTAAGRSSALVIVTLLDRNVGRPPIEGSSTLASVARICRQNGYYNQWLMSKFPTRRNRELIGPYQGIKSAYQGNFLLDQGRALG
jgi:hypothetical protein